jgi:elongation factor G
MEYFAPRIPYRETITKSAKSMYRHKKQSGGAGQFGEVHMLVHPYIEGGEMQKEFPIRGTDTVTLSWGGKLIMNNCIVGGSIDTRFMPAIMKGLMEKMEEGPLTGSYARDIVVNIYDGKMHQSTPTKSPSSSLPEMLLRKHSRMPVPRSSNPSMTWK